MPGGARVIRNNTARVYGAVTDLAERLIEVAAVGTKADAQNAIRSGSKSGRTYRRGAVKRQVKTGGARDTQLRGMGLRGQVNDAAGKTAYVVATTDAQHPHAARKFARVIGWCLTGSARAMVTKRHHVNYTQGQALRLPGSLPTAYRGRSNVGSPGV